MKKSTVGEALRLTKECLYHYWQLDVDYVLNLCAEDVFWIGAVDSQFMQGIEAVTQDFYKTLGELKPCHLYHQQFEVAGNSGRLCTIVGRYLTTTDEEVEYYLQAPQRATFIWEEDKEGHLKIIHMHVSNALGEMAVAPDRLFVNEMGEHARAYLENRIETLTKARKLSVKDEKGSHRFISHMDIYYVAASYKGTLLHTTKGDIQARSSYQSMTEELGNDFLEVHRGCAVNRSYIAEIRRYEVLMENGDSISIPVKRYNLLMQELSGTTSKSDEE